MSALNVTIMKSYLALIILLWSGLPVDVHCMLSCPVHIQQGQAVITNQSQGQPGVRVGHRAWAV